MPTNAWKKEHQKTYGIVYSVRSGIPAAIEQAAKDAGIAPTAYIRHTVTQKLIADGYLQNEAYSGPHGSLRIPSADS